MSKRTLIAVLLVLIVCLFVSAPVFASGISTDFPDSNGASITEVDTSVKKIWGTVTLIIQMLAMAAMVFAGLRYMFASADQKADIKKGLGMLTVGAILVFAASTVIKFVVTAADEII